MVDDRPQRQRRFLQIFLLCSPVRQTAPSCGPAPCPAPARSPSRPRDSARLTAPSPHGGSGVGERAGRRVTPLFVRRPLRVYAGALGTCAAARRARPWCGCHRLGLVPTTMGFRGGFCCVYGHFSSSRPPQAVRKAPLDRGGSSPSRTQPPRVRRSHGGEVGASASSADSRASAGTGCHGSPTSDRAWRCAGCARETDFLSRHARVGLGQSHRPFRRSFGRARGVRMITFRAQQDPVLR